MDSLQESTHDTGAGCIKKNTDNHSTGANNCFESNSNPIYKQPQEVVRPNVDTTDNTMAIRSNKNHKKWNRRLKVLFCCLGYQKNKESIADVASILAEFFADLNIRPTDLAAGFVLLSKYQAAQRQYIVDNHQLNIEQYLSSVPITPETKFMNLSTAEDSHLINDLIYYMNYSLATFGWPLHALDDPCTMCCICPYLKLSCCSAQTRTGTQKNKGTKKRSSKYTSSGNKESTSNQLDRGYDKKPVVVDAAIENHDPKTNQQVVATKKEVELSDPSERRDESNQAKTDKPCSVSDAICDGPPTDFAPIILEDNCCGCNMASFEYRMSSHNYEIVYVTYKASVNVVPFLVVADHSKQSIVVAIRGSMSLSDMVIDMNGTIDPLPIDNCPPDWFCHRGITSAALYVKSKLLDERILEAAFGCRPDLGTNEYSLIFCGHSLGAGVAAILGIIMRPHYPNLKSYLYSPPGGILSLPAVEYTKQFSVGILLGNDCVPRLGIAQLERLRYHTLLSLRSSDKSAGSVLARAICPTCLCGGNKVDYDPSLSLNLLHGTDGRPFDYNGNKIQFQIQPRVLYVPGKLIHIVKNHNFQSRTRRLFNGPIYQAIWTDNTNYDRVIISEGMFRDHLPNRLMHAMKMLFSRTLPARKESTQSSTILQKIPDSTDTPTSSSRPQPQICHQIQPEVSGKMTDPIDNVITRDDNNNSDIMPSDENNNSSPANADYHMLGSTISSTTKNFYNGTSCDSREVN